MTSRHWTICSIECSALPFSVTNKICEPITKASEARVINCFKHTKLLQAHKTQHFKPPSYKLLQAHKTQHFKPRVINCFKCTKHQNFKPSELQDFPKPNYYCKHIYLYPHYTYTNNGSDLFESTESQIRWIDDAINPSNASRKKDDGLESKTIF